uniref:Uncharacterized protein n=1 Tax=viral metagenome TaxID=1070528 RepID=A0A6H1ZF09_9ZZZZ
MQKNTIKNIVGFIAILVVASIFGFLGSQIRGQYEKNKPLGYSEAKIVNVIGTAAAPYRFSADAAASAYSTTTGTIYVGNDVNVLDININTIEASSTMDVILMVESSNDASCVDNGSSIKWVDADPGTATQESATTTFPFGLAAGHGAKHQITNWNGLCARVSVGSASSTVWVSASKQSLNN